MRHCGLSERLVWYMMMIFGDIWAVQIFVVVEGERGGQEITYIHNILALVPIKTILFCQISSSFFIVEMNLKLQFEWIIPSENMTWVDFLSKKKGPILLMSFAPVSFKIFFSSLYRYIPWMWIVRRSQLYHHADLAYCRQRSCVVCCGGVWSEPISIAKS